VATLAAAVTESTTDAHATLTLTSASGELEAVYAPGVGMVYCSLRRCGFCISSACASSRFHGASDYD